MQDSVLAKALVGVNVDGIVNQLVVLGPQGRIFLKGIGPREAVASPLAISSGIEVQELVAFPAKAGLRQGDLLAQDEGQLVPAARTVICC